MQLRREGALPSAADGYAPLAVSSPFRFSCTGKGVYAAREGGGAAPPGDKTLLPYCEGLEARASRAALPSGAHALAHHRAASVARCRVRG